MKLGTPEKFFSFVILGVMAIIQEQTLQGTDWISRDVWTVDGVFSDISPKFGYEIGIGTRDLKWGNPTTGNFASELTWSGYQPWFGGQLVTPGQTFLAGTLTYMNGTVQEGSTTYELHANLNVRATGLEFYIDNHWFEVVDNWGIEIRQTLNGGTDPEADADYIFFTEYPWLGSFRVLEGMVSQVPIYAEFGSLEPFRFGEPTYGGFVVPSTVPNPHDPGVPPSTVPEGPVGFWCLTILSVTLMLGATRQRLSSVDARL